MDRSTVELDDFIAADTGLVGADSPRSFIHDIWTSYFLNMDVKEAASLLFDVSDVDTDDFNAIPARSKKRVASISAYADSDVPAAKAGKLSESSLPVPMLCPKLASFFGTFSSFLNEGNMDGICELVKDVCDEDIIICIRCPGFAVDNVGTQFFDRFFKAMLIAFPDLVRKENGLKLSHDKDGIYFLSEFEYTGTRSVKSPTDREIMGTNDLMSWADREDFTTEEFARIKDADEANQEGHMVMARAVGHRKVYVNLKTNKFSRYETHYRLCDMRVVDGMIANLVPSSKKLSSASK
jgi:hypothetical protein